MCLLVFYLTTGQFAVVNPVAGVVGAKIALDLAFYLWSLLLYRRWAGPAAEVSLVSATLAALIEPFSFQVLRHGGAALGWISFLTGQRRWGTVERTALREKQEA